MIRGLDMHSFDRAIWIYGTDATNNLVDGNMLGLTPTGAFDPDAARSSSSASCIVVAAGRERQPDRRAGPREPQRDRRAATTRASPRTTGRRTTRTIQNNIIGLDPTGTQRRGAKSHGIDINTGTQYTMIGGTDPGDGNVSSGNNQEGVEISHNPLTLHNSIIGNFIGTDLTGNNAPAYAQNGQWGVHLEGDPNCNNAAVRPRHGLRDGHATT